MDVFQCLLLTLLLLLHQATCSSDGAEMIRAVGMSVTFSLPNLHEGPVAWSFQNELILILKLGNPPEVSYFDGNYKTRLAFPNNGNAFTIFQLRTNDSGTYTAQIKNQKITFTLRVYRQLTVPTVTCVGQNCSADSCHYTLHCTMPGSNSGNISYSWSQGGLLWSEGPTVLVAEPRLAKPPPLTCMARNPVSSSNATIISPALLCAGTYSSSFLGIIMGLGLGALVLSALVLLVIYHKHKGRRICHWTAAEATDTEAGAEYTTVYAQVGPSQQMHLQSSSRAQQESPKQMPTPDLEASKTIYLTVKATGQEGSAPMSPTKAFVALQLHTDDEKMSNGMQR
ncbi:SLAM family member 7-like isoform X2 [Phalacrocorax aristotelis]|uniref:SLAM family member 7-like isoform X2 n=1 Tax=Phalacrocorax aristotelis TaxID=126867 RepID=UPI003F4C1583